MRLTTSTSKNGSTFKLIEAAVNRLHVASLEVDQDSEDTAEFLFRKMDVEAGLLETDLTFRNVCRHLRTELENRGVQCSVHRFHNNSDFGGYTLCLSGLMEQDQPVGKAYVHLIKHEGAVCASPSLFYKSPYKVRNLTPVTKGDVSRVWEILSNLGFDKPKQQGVDLNINAYIERQENHGSSKCIDLKANASFEIAERIRKTMSRKYAKTKVVESNNRYTVIGSSPKD
jgi:hypothetical protein